MSAARIGIDLGGTKIEGALLHEDGSLHPRIRVATPEGDYDATLAAIAGLVAELSVRNAAEPVGICTPGAISPATGLLRNSNSVCLNGRALREDLQARLKRPVRIANDADCLALSEASDGAGAGAASVFGVILGTGTGGGIVIDGRLLQGPNAIAGEWGHNPLPWPQPAELPGPACYCGKNGCIETFLSGPGLARDYARGVDARAVAAAAACGDADAVQAMQRYHDRLARSLAGVINILDPEVIVVGGGLGQISSLYTELPRNLPRYVFSDTLRTRILAPVHGDSSGVRGAAWLWPLQPGSPRV